MFSILLCILLVFASVNCGILLWSTKQFRFPTLKVFNDEELNALIQYLDNPTTIILKGNPILYSDELKKLLSNKFTAYVPSTDLHFSAADVRELDYESLAFVSQLQEENADNILCLIVTETTERPKRDADNTGEETTSELTSADNIYELPSGSIWYNADGKAMMYSSKPPLLRMNATSFILGTAVVASFDDRGTYTRLVAVVPVDDRKITLRFKFLWSISGYWTLNSVEIQDVSRYTLVALNSISASRNFSYHCSGETIFSNSSYDIDIELVLYDMQVQPDCANSLFGDANDCITFTTVPIWSGLFVTFILLIGLTFGIGALDSIKTMDLFDNAKTKPLPIACGD